MTRGKIWKDFFIKTVLPVAIAVILFFGFRDIFTKNGETDYLYVWIGCGIPFGIRRMFIWLKPEGGDVVWTAAIIIFDILLCGLVGGFVLVWKLLVAAWYIPLTVYRLISINKISMAEISAEQE